MFLNIQDKHGIRSRAWSTVVYKFGGTITAYADAINVNRETARDWINNPTAKVPFHFLALTEMLTGVSIERLSPFTEEENKMRKIK